MNCLMFHDEDNHEIKLSNFVMSQGTRLLVYVTIPSNLDLIISYENFFATF